MAPNSTVAAKKPVDKPTTAKKATTGASKTVEQKKLRSTGEKSRKKTRRETYASYIYKGW